MPYLFVLFIELSFSELSQAPDTGTVKEGDMIENTYSTGQIAKIIGIHENTVRTYEDWGLIPRPFAKQTGTEYLVMFI